MGKRSLVRPAAATAFVEAAHDGNGGWDEWLEGLLRVANALFCRPLLGTSLAVQRQGHFEVPLFKSDTFLDAFPRQSAAFARAPMDATSPLIRFPRLVASTRDIIDSAHPDAQVLLGQALDNVKAEDVLALIGLADASSVFVGVHCDERVELLPAERRLLAQLALHLEAGLRLRLDPSNVIAILHPDGRVLHAEAAHDAKALHASLARHVGSIERQRAQRQRTSSEALETWKALVSGSWGLMEREDSDGRRHYLVVETPRAPKFRALTATETAILDLSARGLSGKQVCYGLGTTASTVSHALATSALKLGIATRTELVGLVAQLLGTGTVQVEPEGLTLAEREVLSLVRLGWTNAEIALHRGRAERTVANQVAALLNKVGAPSRRALAAKRPSAGAP